jgi:hypothetical protein
VAYTDPFGLCPPEWLCKLIGARAGQDAANFYANVAGDPSNSWATRTAANIAGAVASLWTPDTYATTATVLTTAASVAPAVGTFTHFGIADDAASFANGLRPGSYATNRLTTLRTGAQAADRLSLSVARPDPNAAYIVKPEWWRFVRGPTRVSPIPGRTGGGWEYFFKGGTGPGTVSGPTLIP